ncbi:hypothetical protein YS110_00115 [Acidovorax sp. YS12]|nr:hypothetical protein YS110_00115 [Acidovorax sp. YS12]
MLAVSCGHPGSRGEGIFEALLFVGYFLLIEFCRGSLFSSWRGLKIMKKRCGIIISAGRFSVFWLTQPAAEKPVSLSSRPGSPGNLPKRSLSSH